VGIRPSKAQKGLLKLAFEVHRHVYNDAAEAINWGIADDKKSLRALLLNGDAWQRELVAHPNWKGVLYDLRDGALDDALNACESARTLNKEREFDEDNWTLKPRDRRSATETFTLYRKHLNKKPPKRKSKKLCFWNALLGYAGRRDCMKLCNRTKDAKLPDVFAHDVTVTHNRVLDTYMLAIKVKHDGGDVECGRERNPICSIDPGVRTFATVYDPAGAMATKWGCVGPERPASGDLCKRKHKRERDVNHADASANARLWRIANQIQSLKKRTNGANSRKRKHMERAAARLGCRTRNLVDELHHKLAIWLCRGFDTILLPELSAKEISAKRDENGTWKRKIGKRTVRQLYSLAHYRFHAFLKHKAAQFGSKVVPVSEAFTTMTCGACGFMKRNVGRAEVFACDRCGTRIDRDINGARNIYLKFLHDAEIV
jgi:IS605 OrfB family transposase